MSSPLSFYKLFHLSRCHCWLAQQCEAGTGLSLLDKPAVAPLWPAGRLAKRGIFRGVGALLLLVMVGAFNGCEQAPPPPTDPAKAPWLLDPQSQVDSLKDGNFRIRGIAAFNLGNMGALAADAVDDLEKIAKDDPHPKVRQNASEALQKIRAAKGKMD